MILLIPLGEVEPRLLHHVAKPLSATFDLPCRLGDRIDPPAAAYDARRGQYRGADILRQLSRLEIPDAQRVLGIVDADCCAPGLNFIFGQAQRHGRNAFIALARPSRPS